MQSSCDCELLWWEPKIHNQFVPSTSTSTLNEHGFFFTHFNYFCFLWTAVIPDKHTLIIYSWKLGTTSIHQAYSVQLRWLTYYSVILSVLFTHQVHDCKFYQLLPEHCLPTQLPQPSSGLKIQTSRMKW